MSAGFGLHPPLNEARESGPFRVPRSQACSRWKSWFDYFLAAVQLVLSAPIILIAMELVRLTSRGPAIYR
jgi:lipopolysaccharide/colanic/teichoic acid biosynthesis glycosyltransferase